jgi:hypothetical protein
MTDFTDLITQAKKMQEKMKETQEALKKIEVEGISGGNAIRVIMNGDGELKKISLDVDEMKLEPIPVENTHRYFSTEDGIDQVVSVRLYELRSLSIATNEEGIKVGEVLCLGASNWGGELDVLVIVRPIGHSGLSNDRFATSLALDWLSA